MGLAASQARLLTLTSRMADLEMNSMRCSNQKMILANKSDAISAKYADALIAFWDGKSKGTKHMIDLAKRYELKVKVVIFN